jgi:hypothetical protein
MTLKRIARAERYTALSTDDKPDAPTVGSTLYESDTGYLWIFNGYAWIPKSAFLGQTVNYKQVSLAQTADTRNVMTATAQAILIDAVICHVAMDLSAVATFTGISVQTDDGTAIDILDSTAGAKAKLTGNFYHVFQGPVVTAATKIIQFTIGGATAGTGATLDVTTLWRPVVAGGYYLNA